MDYRNTIKGVFGDTLGIILLAAYFPAFVAWFGSHVILISLVQMAFGNLDDHPHGYDSPIARGAGYLALSASVLIGVAVAILETVAVIAALAGKPLYR